ncbi:MAG: RimK family alpha-L-glutamate ligase [Proteobacteria bacterium]|nr:MAG: RimK family alpha-L-glutamate ligase [Pseudomonadota bacterium]
MRIAILSRNKNLHSIRRLLQEAKKVGVECFVINPLDCQLVVEGRSPRVLVNGQELPEMDAVLPRIGTSITDYGLAVVKQFEAMGTYVVNTSQGIAESRDKMRSLQILSHARMRVPSTIMTRGSKNLRAVLQTVKEMPAVLKILRGTQGVGVMLLHSPVSVSSVLDTLAALDEEVLVQQFLKQGAGKDYRLFVVGGQVVATMMRTAPQGEFRSNIHRGGEGKPLSLPASYRRLAVRAADIFHLGCAGVDIMDGPEGPTLLEVNSSPGFEGIEKATGRNIAAPIIRFIVQEIRKKRAQARRAKRKKPAAKKTRARKR